MTHRRTALSADQYNQLQAEVLDQFLPHFALRAKLLFMRDVANKPVVNQVDELERLGLPIDRHRMLPDMVLYLPRKKWLYLIAIAGASGPISSNRYHDLERMLSESPAWPVYVNVLADFDEYSRYGGSVAWNTGVWIAEVPNHMIHHNGVQFLGVHDRHHK